MLRRLWVSLALILPLAQFVAAQADQKVRLAQPNWWPYTLTLLNTTLPDLKSWSQPLPQDAGLFSERGMINYCLAEIMVKSGIERRDLGFTTPLQLLSYQKGAYALKSSYYNRQNPESKSAFTCYYYRKADTLYFFLNRAGLKP